MKNIAFILEDGITIEYLPNCHIDYKIGTKVAFLGNKYIVVEIFKRTYEYGLIIHEIIIRECE